MYRMMCDVCKQNPAMRKVINITKEKKQVQYICDDCYHKRQQNATLSIIKGIASGLSAAANSAPAMEHVCHICGTTASSFMQTGLVGCDNCYVDLAPEISQMIRATQGQINHLGKSPYGTGSGSPEPPIETDKAEEMVEEMFVPDPDAIEIPEAPKAESEQLKLKKALEAAVLMEDYEKAIELRDKLASMTEEEEHA